MSRIGKKTITVPKGVVVTVCTGSVVSLPMRITAGEPSIVCTC